MGYGGAIRHGGSLQDHGEAKSWELNAVPWRREASRRPAQGRLGALGGAIALDVPCTIACSSLSWRSVGNNDRIQPPSTGSAATSDPFAATA
jgi:hypothetical protein